ncbi:EfeM/EfeO family lipoprotein [Moraxella sp. Tifton1]|uniref:iron uptake system protein EfeO n=1 Tax=Moraxella oculi TaxID=2940516 RepID=UPI00201377C4|nr:iron uptake system protein EfeO [Moraxella sp. Tifton1]MCL1624088.1 EfeM/EfeO family lipoprotein [Moraxella sp. Tifton1]
MKTVKSTLVIALSALLLTACGDNKPAETKTEVSTQTQAEQVSTVDLSAETAEYKKWVEGQMDGLVTDTEKFVSLLKAGKTDEAKALYPLVRMYFERSEPIAESFGDLDPRIDNREADLEKDEKWTGFHAIEKILWTKNTTKGTEMLADQLLADTKELRAKIPTAEVTPDLMIQGAVDLLNEVTTTKITGEEEIFSKTDLYDFKANIEGAQKIFQILTPKIEAKNPELVADLKVKFAEVHALLDVHKINEQHYKDYDELSKDEIKALAEAVNKLGEPLAQMGVVMQ